MRKPFWSLDQFAYSKIDISVCTLLQLLILKKTSFSTTSLYLRTEWFSLGTKEGIRKLYFEGKNLENNEANTTVDMQVLKTSFSKGTFWTVNSLSLQLIPDWLGEGRPRKWVLDDSSKKTDATSGHLFLLYNPNSSFKQRSYIFGVPTLCILNIVTVPTLCILYVGTVPTFRHSFL